MTQHFIIGISGASGAIYGVRLLEVLRAAEGVETHLIMSKMAHVTTKTELDMDISAIQALADHVYQPQDLAACLSSGSFKTAGMIVAPCSMRSLAEIANGMSSNLLTRAADVVLKERRKLVLLPRETPLNSAHLRNMLAVSDMGGIIAPPVPAFYQRPESLDGMVNHTVGRILDLFDLEHDLVSRWQGLR